MQACLLAGLAGLAQAQGSLRNIPVPLPANLDQVVKDRFAATQLGKALFWDQQAGGDGQTACATCHYHAGVDARVTNTVHPGHNHRFDSGRTPGSTVTAADFPLAGDDILGSQGIVASRFLGLDPNAGAAADLFVPFDDGVFFPQRQITERNSPSTLMAIFYTDNFWDGRANSTFNGVDISGSSKAVVYVNQGGNLVTESMQWRPASAASQSVGPPMSPVEMTCAGRSFAMMGRKLLGRQPLAQQLVARDDSSLGSLSMAPLNGLSVSYQDLIRAAFRDPFHSSTARTSDGFTQMEANFTLFWGIANMLYNASMVPDQTPQDHYAEGVLDALSPSQRRGAELFRGKARCDQCHGGPEFTAASIRNGNNGRAFANIGITDQTTDPGRGRGMFKSPTLRNVELTAPYFHTGKYLTLRQVVDFYDRGGDYDNVDKDAQVRRLGLTEGEKTDLVAYLLSLTDDRVRFERAPFDHPSLALPNDTPLPSVGATGRTSPIRRYLDADPFQR
jgi:cytochrome c peroxidase